LNRLMMRMRNGKGLLPPLKNGMALQMSFIEATERFTQHPPRYTESQPCKKNLRNWVLAGPLPMRPLFQLFSKGGMF